MYSQRKCEQIYMYTYQESMIKESLCKKIKCAGVTVVTKYRLSRFILMAEKYLQQKYVFC